MDNGAEIPEAWMPTVKKHESQRYAASQQTPEESTVQKNNIRIETRQSLQTTAIHNAVPDPVDPID